MRTINLLILSFLTFGLPNVASAYSMIACCDEANDPGSCELAEYVDDLTWCDPGAELAECEMVDDLPAECTAVALECCDPIIGDTCIPYGPGDSCDGVVEVADQLVPFAAWDSVICTAGPTGRCYAHSPSSKELWHSVVSWCDLYERVEYGGFVPTIDGWDYACDLDGRPETFTDVLCFHDTVAITTVCFGGHDGWFVEVEPACAPNNYTVTPWPDGACDVDGVGYTEYDMVLVNHAGPKWLARATDAGDAFLVIPECAVPVGGVPAGDPFSCE